VIITRTADEVGQEFPPLLVIEIFKGVHTLYLTQNELKGYI
jgi:hypothetical protein